MNERAWSRSAGPAPSRRAAIATLGALALAAPVSLVRAQAPVPAEPALPAPPIVVGVDPGHGGREIGAVYGRGGRAEVLEKDVNLRIALLLAEELRAAGYLPLLTRTEDAEVNVPAWDRNGDGRIDVDDDLQARIDLLNEGGAALFISIHNNGVTSSRVRGTSTWYSAAHPLGHQSKALAVLVQAELVAGLRGAGYDDVVDQGANDDPPLQKPYGHLFLTGPKTPRVARPSAMPGVIGESLFVTSDVESQFLKDEAVLHAIAAAYRRAVDAYFQALANEGG